MLYRAWLDARDYLRAKPFGSLNAVTVAPDALPRLLRCARLVTHQRVRVRDTVRGGVRDKVRVRYIYIYIPISYRHANINGLSSLSPSTLAFQQGLSGKSSYVYIYIYIYIYVYIYTLSQYKTWGRCGTAGVGVYLPSHCNSRCNFIKLLHIIACRKSQRYSQPAQKDDGSVGSLCHCQAATKSI